MRSGSAAEVGSIAVLIRIAVIVIAAIVAIIASIVAAVIGTVAISEGPRRSRPIVRRLAGIGRSGLSGGLRL